jgi:hypothetical protein
MRITPRALVYLYVALVILEGALRKWFLPQALNSLVAIARDPVALYLVWYGWRRGFFSPAWLRQLWLFTAVLLAAGGLLSMLETSLPFDVWAYGLRTNLLHFPLILIIPRLLEPEDLNKLLKRLLALALPIALIMLWQYRSPLSSWVNKGAIEGVSQLTAVFGKVRPPGPFSFITGAAEYFALVNAILLGSLFDRRLHISWILYGLVATLLAVSVSGSRLLLATVAVVWAGSLGLRQLRHFRLPPPRFLLSLGAAVVALVLLTALTPLGALVDEGWSTTADRVEVANQHDGGFLNRVSSTLSVPDSVLWETPLFGHGLGLGTNFGAKVVTGNVGFALSETELQRVLLESGVLIGSVFLLLRQAIVVYVFHSSWRALGRFQQLPISLMFANLPVIVYGQIGRPTSMGFVVLCMAFSLAAARFGRQQVP